MRQRQRYKGPIKVSPSQVVSLLVDQADLQSVQVCIMSKDLDLEGVGRRHG